jgi:hypothetical protein
MCVNIIIIIIIIIVVVVVVVVVVVIIIIVKQTNKSYQHSRPRCRIGARRTRLVVSRDEPIEQLVVCRERAVREQQLQEEVRVSDLGCGDALNDAA